MEDFHPRDYQVDLYERAVEHNTIIYLPTGSGKTYIAVLLIKKYRNQVQLPYSEGGKRIVFIVNTVPLVTQQSQYITRHTGLTCRGYSGDMGVDYWSKETWYKEIEETQVLVMVGEIFSMVLSHGQMELSKVCLLIFDECHKAVGSHPMRKIMKCFEHVDKDQHPRILGLTATLLNSNVKVENVAGIIRDLEITLNSRVATVSSDGMLKEYNNLDEKFIKYDPPESYDIANKLNALTDYMIEILSVIKLQGSFNCDLSSKELAPKPKNTRLKNLVEDGREHIRKMGLYGGSKALLLHIVQLENMKKSTDDLQTMAILEFLITQMTKMRKIIEDKMNGFTELERMYKFSSDQVLKTFEALKHFENTKQPNQKFCTIVFVQRKSTAYILYNILENLHRLNEEYSFLLPDYIIGYASNPFTNPREALCISKWNKEALLKFRSGRTNCVVATDVVDEGIDVPACTLIIRYDLPMDFRSYIQSKGRARHRGSRYIMLLSTLDESFVSKYYYFQSVDRHMKKALIGHTDDRKEVTAEEMDESLYKTEIEPYVVVDKDGVMSRITDLSSISLINRYCSILFKSKFVTLSPTWILHKSGDGTSEDLLYKVSLTLPPTSPLKTTIDGDFMSSIQLAKRSAALKACIELHKIGEFGDNLLPTEPSAVLAYTDNLFPHWQDETFNAETGIPGTTGNKRIHHIEHPQSLYSAFPIADRPLYLHLIQSKPSYPKPFENRQLVFYKLLNDEAGYALLTTKPLPQLADFPIFMNVGELNVHLEVNHATFELSHREIAEIRFFHWIIFKKVLNVIKDFMVFDEENLSNSFLIVPTNKKGEICWSTILRYKGTLDIPETPPSDPLNVREYDQALVKPNYRASSSVYIVTQICDDLMAESAFPNGDFHSYVHYYKDRHGIVIRDTRQPMLEVKVISKKINCIRPRGIKAGLSKRKYADILEDFEEHFVGELCNITNFSPMYWLKATYLPSVLHRIGQLLVADDLRTQIASETGLGILKLPKGSEWAPLVIKPIDVEQHPDAILDVPAPEEWIVEPSTAPLDIPGPEIDTLESNLYPWKKESEPSNLYREIEKIQLIDVEYYNQFMSTPMSSSVDILKKQNHGKPFPTKSSVRAPPLHILRKKDPNGPSPVTIMQALTAKMANDVFDLERLETLGDSLLKFAVSLYLYEAYPKFTEGQLTAVKGKMVGNRNLFYCGENKKIPGRMKIDTFEATSNYIAPAYTVFRPLQELLLASETSPNVLYELSVPMAEQLTGEPSRATIDRIEEKVLAWNDTNAYTGMEPFLDVQSVADKSVSDCVEALIGVYFKTMGLTGAFKILTWFCILPKNLKVDEVLHQPPSSPRIGLGNPDDHMPQATYIENQIGYKFNDRAFLMQALTHPSYTPNNITPSYERLEFLGDAILDLLITVHIYETCGNLTPGALTDLRSALVNNITFACLAVKYGFHTALMAYAPKLQEVIERFVKFQADREYAVDDELLWILLEEDDCNMAEFVDVPKMLGDLFESIVGAIYLDTGKDLQKVWEIVYGLMHKEIIAFSQKVPKQPIRVIYETPGANPRFSKPSNVNDSSVIMVTLEVTIAGKLKTFHGFGANKKQAKCAASKQALKCIRSNI